MRAFPTIDAAVHERARARGIDLELSFRRFMGALLGCDPGSPRIARLIESAAQPVPPWTLTGVP